MLKDHMPRGSLCATEEELHESEERYRGLFENNHAIMLLIDPDNGAIVDANDAASTYYGWSIEELKMRRIDEINTLKREEVFAEMQLALSEKRNYFLFRHRLADGTIRDVEVYSGPIPLKGKRLLYSIVHDITERKKADQQVKERIKELETLYSLGEIAGKEDLTLDKLYQELTDILPQGCQYPEIACARIMIGDSEFRTNNFAESAWMQSAPVKVSGTVVGKIEVGYLEEMPKEGEGPFLKEEKLLIDSIAERLGQITERKLAEKEIRRSLREKETLLAEIHHRVKNNMQIISSLLSLQSRYIEDEKALSLINNCENRIKSMSLVHEKLYLSKDLSEIDFHDYMKDLSARLFQVHRVDSRVVRFSSHITDGLFNIETAIPLGLIINELISNALKHAFPEGGKGNIAVKLTKNTKPEEYTLTVTDDGIGFPEGMDHQSTETFGLQLVEMLAEQLHGTMELDRNKGTSFKIIFKEQEYRKRI